MLQQINQLDDAAQSLIADIERIKSLAVDVSSCVPVERQELVAVFASVAPLYWAERCADVACARLRKRVVS